MPTGEITELLSKLATGDRAAESQLMPLVYAELRRLATRHLRGERRDHTLRPTEVVHEAYLRLVRLNGTAWESRMHFFATASRLMRHVLVDYARASRAFKRGGGQSLVELDEAVMCVQGGTLQVLAVDLALAELAKFDPRQARIVELRFFAGLSHEEIAEVLKISARTVKREWSLAKAWLRGELAGGERCDAGPLGAD